MNVHVGDMIITAPRRTDDTDATMLCGTTVRGVLMRSHGDGLCTVRIRSGKDITAFGGPSSKATVVPDHEFTASEREWVPLARAVAAEASQAAFHLPESDSFAGFIAANAPGILETQEQPETEDGLWHITVWMDREVLGEYSWGLDEERNIVLRYWFGRIPGWRNELATRANRVLGIVGESGRLDDTRFSLVWTDDRGPSEFDLSDSPAT